MLEKLKKLEFEGCPVFVGVVGMGAMGLAIAHKLSALPGVRLSFIADKEESVVERAAARFGNETVATTDCMGALVDESISCDVLVEATNSLLAGYEYCSAAIERGAHCVLMNAELDLVLGHLLRYQAGKKGVVVTSDAGDQHGVLSRLIDEISLWGMDLVQAGNMKGFLDRHRTLADTYKIAQELKLNPVQCQAYTDGSKLNIEMAIVANQFGLVPTVPGMEGPRADKVQDALELFDFDSYRGAGRVDYILGVKEHGGGVYVVARSDDPVDEWYLNYYKVTSAPPYYLFFRPYHLCHFETITAICRAVFDQEPICSLREGRVADCYAYAKKQLIPGEIIERAMGSDELYGMVDCTIRADSRYQVPQLLLDCEELRFRPRVKRRVERDAALSWDDIEMPESRLVELWHTQNYMLEQHESKGISGS